MEVPHIKEKFSLFDSLGSGEIPQSKIGTVLCSLGFALNEEELKAITTGNNNGTIDFQSFLAVCSGLSSKMPVLETSRAALEAAFLFYDKGKTGYISVNDLTRVMTNFGDIVSDAEVKALFAGLNIDMEGRCKWRELLEKLVSPMDLLL